MTESMRRRIQAERDRAIEGNYVDGGGVLRNELGRVVGRELTEHSGRVWAGTQEEAYQASVAESCARYTASRARMTDDQRAEEAAEIRAAFGPGETIVNVITGERTKT
ncbi:hypothetical protein LCGC14_2519060 [marine sediment metagenome]|uniref:Uncharacterized protein n=1 Tax=marine sediment metagenome TaxID=412755 RepID=A0A0F9D8H2_9ZZZZ